MTAALNVAFNIYPQWVATVGLGNFLQPLQQAGLNALEFELDSNLPEWQASQALMEDCADLGLRLVFHGPYRFPLRLEGFRNERRQEVIEQVRPLYRIAQQWAERQGEFTTVVVHGGVSSGTREADLLEDTCQYLGWGLEEFSQIYFAFENGNPARQGQTKIGDSRQKVLEVVETLNHPRLGICWDMGHDYLAGTRTGPTAEWLALLRHVHIHDVDEEGKDHYPLIFGRVPWDDWLHSIRGVDQPVCITLEVKGGQLMGWSWEKIMASLAGSIAIIRQGAQ